MGWLQRFITDRAGDTHASGIEAESRNWHLQCPKCGHSKSLWEVGGIRYKAYGSKSVLGRCSGCGTAAGQSGRGKLRFLKLVYIDP